MNSSANATDSELSTGLARIPYLNDLPSFFRADGFLCDPGGSALAFLCSAVRDRGRPNQHAYSCF
jgi:hypothetical protein